MNPAAGCRCAHIWSSCAAGSSSPRSACVVGAVIGWFLYDPVFTALQRPIELVAERARRPHHAELRRHRHVVRHADQGLVLPRRDPVEPVVALPVLGVRDAGADPRGARLRRSGSSAVAVPLFLAGAFLAWWVLPNAVRLLTEFTPSGATNIIDAQTYLGLRHAHHARVRHRVPAADRHGRAELRRDRHGRHLAQGLAVGGAARRSCSPRS